MEVKPTSDLLRELRSERGMSQETLSHEAYAIEKDGTSLSQIKAIELGTRRPSAQTILALAEVLDVEPEIFPEYRLAVARLSIDESVVNLPEAMRNLERSSIEPTGISRDLVREHSRTGKLKKKRELERVLEEVSGS
jgi:transcriptional regulator with XRE-family HTH domain